MATHEEPIAVLEGPQPAPAEDAPPAIVKAGDQAVENAAPADVLFETRWNNTTDPERAMDFTYKSGARPLDGYTIKRGLGWGGFGEVYYAVSDGGKEVALKLIQRHLDIELRGVAQCLNLKHPNLLAVFDVRRSVKGENWIIMEYVAGVDLLRRLEEAGGALPMDEALDWLDGMGAAIDYLHQQGIVHRDLKPGNVFKEGSLIKVGDYGLSKFISASRRSGQTQSVGTVHYMAPEISTGNYGRNVDVYSAAVIAFEMLTGDVPFDGETAGEVLMKHLTAEPALEKLDEKFRPLFAKALAKSPPDRYATIRELADAIRAVAGIAVPVTPPVVPPPPPPAPEPVRPAAPASATLRTSLPPPAGTFRAKRRAFSDSLWAMFLAGLLSMVLPLIVLAAVPPLFDWRQVDYTRSYLSLAVLSGLASWGLLGFARFWDRQKVDAAMRRLTMLLFGLSIGGVGLALNIWLNSQVPEEWFFEGPQIIFSEIWAREVLQYLVVYATIFAITFVVPDWGKTVCADRSCRFSLWRVIWPSALAMCIALFFKDGMRSKAPEPAWVGGVVAMTAVIIQWVSRFEPPIPEPRFGRRRWHAQRPVA